MSAAPDLDARLDELYASDPDEFTKTRDALASELRKSGEKESAAQVKKLRRPSKAASIVNRLSREHGAELGELTAAGERLREIGSRLGGESGAELRKASAAERDAVERLVAIARDDLGASGATLDRVRETLQAVAGDEDLAATVRAGRLDRERQAVGFGTAELLAASVATTPAKKSGAKRERAAKDTAQLRKAKERLAAAESDLEDAEAEREEAADALERAEAAADEARKQEERAEKAVARARRAAEKARERVIRLED